jgi:SulP family sulfate permease
VLASSLRGYRREWVGADAGAALALLVIVIPEQLATSRLAGMPPVTGFYAFVAGSVLFAVFGTNPHLSVGADSTIAPLFAVGVGHLAATGSARYVDLVGILAVMVGAIVALVGILRLGWIAEFMSVPIITGFLAGVAVIIVVHQLPDLLGLPGGSGSTVHRMQGVVSHLSQVNGWSLAIGLGVMAVVVVAARIDRRFPATLVAMIGSVVLVAVLGLERSGLLGRVGPANFFPSVDEAVTAAVAPAR